MYDSLYVGGSLAFFAVMIAFVHLCDRLGRTGANGGTS